MTDNGVIVGQSFTAPDGGIKVTVIRVGARNQKARFKIENLKTERASYTIMVKRKSGADPDRIDYKTDDPNRSGEFELSADQTIGIEIRRNLSYSQESRK
jgi:hypothetical protein